MLMGIGKEFWFLGKVLIAEPQAADSIVSVKLWTASSMSFECISLEHGSSKFLIIL